MLRRDLILEVIRGNQRSNSFRRSQVQEGGHQFIHLEVLETLNRMLESFQEEVSKSREPLDLMEQ
jgi:hypothetical protein